jgi:hypothetical protein
MPSILKALAALAVSIATMIATGAHAQLDVQKKLAQIDRTFICPEDLPTEQAKQDALNLFLEQVAVVQPQITIAEIIEYRVSLLKKHQCRQTLANIGASPSQASGPAPAAPSTPMNDHWERAGRIGGANGITITVDMDSMTSAGPGRMRTWIKYRNDKPDRKGIKETLVYEQLDCARNYHSTISLYSYAADGHIVDSSGGRAEEPIVPESLLAGILPFTCAAHGLSTR